MNPIQPSFRTRWRSSLGAFGVLLSALALVAFAGCDSLEVADPNAPSPDAVSVQSLVSGVEGAMRADMNVYIQVTGIFGREAYYFEPADPRYTGELFTGPLDPGGFLLTRPWRSRYRTIRNATILLERAAELQGAERAGVEGFAKAIIGYQLLLNLNYLDDNGIKIEFSEDVSTPFVGKQQAYAEIERYFNESLSALSNAGGAFSFSLTSEGFGGFDTPATFAQFVRGLQARVALYQEKWQAALDALSGSFVDADAPMDLGVYHAYSTGSGDRLNPVFEVPTAPSVKLRAHPDVKTFAEPGDQRYLSKVLDRTDDPSFNPSPPAANGLVSPLVITLAQSSTDRFPIMRNEELLLIRAEANFRLGNMAAAEADVNAVRAAAGLAPVTLSPDTALDQILHERMYSLLVEGHRWIDLRRTGRLGTLPTDQVGTPPQPGKIFDKWPRPIDEIPESG
jgi:hypothetical protein